MTAQQTDSGAASEERVELATYKECPKQLFAYGRLWDFDRLLNKRSGEFQYQYGVAAYRPSTDLQTEMDVRALLLSGSFQDCCAWVNDDLLIYHGRPGFSLATPAIRKVSR